MSQKDREPRLILCQMAGCGSACAAAPPLTTFASCRRRCSVQAALLEPGAFFLAVVFRVAFFFVTFFLVTFYLATFFLATIFLATFFLATFFLVVFFLATFYPVAFIFAAGLPVSCRRIFPSALSMCRACDR